MPGLMQELAYAARTLKKSPGVTVSATATIALGVGACVAIFSVANAVLLRPLPYADAERLVLVWGQLRARHVNDWPFSPPDFRDLRQHATVFEDLAGATPPGRTPVGGDGADPEQVRASGATPNLFRLLGAKIERGRDFIDADALPQAQAPPPAALPPATAPSPLPTSVIISHEFWRRRYGGDPAVVGRFVEFGNGRAQIVGVLAPEFDLLFPPRANFQHADVWTAMRINFDQAPRTNAFLRVVGRLKQGVTLERAQGAVDAVAADLRQQFPLAKTTDLHFRVVPMHEDLVSGVRPAILSLLGAVFFVLLIAWANVANLLMVRASARHRELAIRTAIGSGRWRLVRQMLTESLVLAGGGTILGIALAYAGVRVLAALAPPSLPRFQSIDIDLAVLGFSVAAGLLTALGCGVLPALRASRADLMDVLRQSGGAPGLRGGRRARFGIVTIEVALSFVLLVGAGLVLRSFIALNQVDPGYDPRNVLTFLLTPRQRQPAQRAVFMRQVQDRLLGLPGVQSVSAASPLPLDGRQLSGRWGTADAQADPASYQQANFHIVLPGYFETLRTRLIAGRTFTDADNVPDRRVMIVDERLAVRAFPNGSAVGQQLLARIATPEPEWFEVIGVVAHQRHASLASDGPNGMFFPDAVVGSGQASRWAVRTAGDPNDVVAAVRAAVAEIDPRAPLAEVEPMTALVDRARASMAFTLFLFAIFGVMAVVLASVGLYAVLSALVRQRTAEIGMRMVLGASRRAVFRLIVGEALRLSATGLVAGLIAAFGLSRLIASLLVGVGPNDPMTFATTTVLFFTIAVLASWIPAWRAAALTPTTAIRRE